MLPDLQAFLRTHRNATQFGVYEGQRRLGTIVEVEGKALAFDALGDALGSFRKRSHAMRSIPSPPETKPLEARRG
jgi:hypothetical protein